MNKALHVLVYLFLALAAAALWFELQLNAKRALLTDRNRLQEDYLVRIAKTVENEDPAKDAAFEIQKDGSPVEAKLVDAPDMENVLADYNAHLEQANLKTYEWDNMSAREKLRAVYVLDEEGNPVMDGNQPNMRDADENKMLNGLFESAKTQQKRLNDTRAELTSLRGKLKTVVDELNDLKPVARQDKVTIVERNAKIAKLEEEKQSLEDEITKRKAEIEELNTQIASVKDELATTKDELEERKEYVEKQKKTIDQLKKLIQEMSATRTGTQRAGTAVASIPMGDKGTIATADNENMFAVVRFTDEAMKELKGGNPINPLPALELGVKRDGKIVGRIRLRQEIKDKTFVICDILGNWAQDAMQKGDVVYAD